jgi:hypothetical protein
MREIVDHSTVANSSHATSENTKGSVSLSQVSHDEDSDDDQRALKDTSTSLCKWIIIIIIFRRIFDYVLIQREIEMEIFQLLWCISTYPDEVDIKTYFWVMRTSWYTIFIWYHQGSLVRVHAITQVTFTPDIDQSNDYSTSPQGASPYSGFDLTMNPTTPSVNNAYLITVCKFDKQNH